MATGLEKWNINLVVIPAVKDNKERQIISMLLNNSVIDCINNID